jgi:hypothetical protein
MLVPVFPGRALQEARRELLSGIGADPAEPALHLLLGHVYDKIGLKKLAAGAF